MKFSIRALALTLSVLAFSCNGSGPSNEGSQASADSASLTVKPDDTVTLPIAPQMPVRPVLPDYDTSQWTEAIQLDSSIQVDMRYATENNFVEEKMYDCGRCFLRPEVARAVVQAHNELQKQGLGLKMLDCYRPRPIQWKLWEKVPDPRYVSDPRKGSMHNRGAAVDVTLVGPDGEQLEMGTPYDFFGPEAHPSYTNLPDSVLANRQLLRETMLAHGFQPIRTEWWHFSYGGRSYEISDMLWKCY